MLGRSGRHEDALAIYVLVLNDLLEAEAYCERVINDPNASADAKQVFLYLLRLYLDPQSGVIVILFFMKVQHHSLKYLKIHLITL